MLNRSINSSFNQSQVSSKSKEAQPRNSIKDKQTNQKLKINAQGKYYSQEYSSDNNPRVHKLNKQAEDGQFRWKLMEMTSSVEQAPAAAYREVQMGHKWGTIDYRDSKYHGKILFTQTQCQSTETPLGNLEITNNIHNNFYTQTKDGPGILILDSNLWIIGQWKNDNLTGGKSVYVISPDGGVLQLHLSEGQGVKEILSRINEVSYIGNICRNNSLGANGHYNSIYNKASEKYSKYIIMGDRVNESMSVGEKSSEDEDLKYKWVVDLSQEYYNQSKSNACIYYMEASRGGADVNDIKEISLDAEDRQKQRVGNYDYFMSRLRQILVELQPKSSEYGFKIIENKFTTINTTSITKPSGQLKTGQMNYNGIETIICSNAHNNQSVYIRILAQSGDGTNNFGIEELALLVKEPTSSQNSTPRNLQISIPNLQNFTYSRKYSYIIKQSSCSLSNSPQSLTAILPHIQVEQKLEGRIKNEGRYRYTYHYNCQQGDGKDKMYMGSSNKEFGLMCAEKKRQHLCSVNFVDKSHKSLQSCLHKMLKEISFVYYQVKLFEIDQTNSNLATKMSTIQSGVSNNNAKQNNTQKVFSQKMEQQKEKDRQGEYLGRREKNTINTGLERLNTDGEVNLASQKDIKEELQKILQEGQQRSRSKGHNLNLEGIRNPATIQSIGQTVSTCSARSKIQKTRLGASGIRKRTYTANTKQKDQQKIEQYGDIQDSNRCSGGTWEKRGHKQFEKEKEQHRSTVYARTDQKKVQDQSDGVDNEEENDIVEQNYSCQKKPKERKYSQCPSQTPSRKSPSVCASMKSPSNSISQSRQKQSCFRPSAFPENEQKGQFQYPSPSKSKVSNTSECNSNMDHYKFDLVELTKQYSQINSQMLRQAKKNHIPLNIIKNTKDDCESQYALTRSNTVSYHNVAGKSGVRMNNNNQYDEECWGQEYRYGGGSGCGGSNKGHGTNTRKRTQSIYDDYVQKYK